MVGYAGTKETAATRIMGELTDKPIAKIVVSPEDELASLYKLWYLTGNSTGLLHNCKSWKELLDAWSVARPVIRAEALPLGELRLFLKEEFEPCGEGNLAKQVRDSKVQAIPPYARQDSFSNSRSR